MKSLLILICTAAAATVLPAQTAVDVKAVVSDAVANTFDGKNYSWTTTLTKPDGGNASITGQLQGTTSLVTIQDENGTHALAVVGEKRFHNDGSGWFAAPERDEKDVHIRVFHPEAGGARPPRMILVYGRPENPERPLRDLSEKATTWTVQGSTFTAEVTGLQRGPGGFGPPRGKDGGRPGPMADAKTILTLQIQDGVVSSATTITSGTITPPGESARQIERRATTAITQVGTTQVALPAELQTLLAQGN